MIIGMHTVYWLITGESSEKTLFKLIKMFGVNLPQSLQKNFLNATHQKHLPRKETLIEMQSFLEEFCFKVRPNLKSSALSKELELINLQAKIELSTFTQNFDYLESGYRSVFEGMKRTSADNFFIHEVERVFYALREVWTPLEEDFIQLNDEISDEQKAVKMSDLSSKFEVAFKRNTLLSSVVDIENDILNEYISIPLGNQILKTKFSLNLLLYLCACVDVCIDDEESIFQLIFDELCSVDGGVNAPFNHYICIMKKARKRKGKSNSDEFLAEMLELEQRTFARYKSGERRVPLKGILSFPGYFMVAFWVNFLKPLRNSPECHLLIRKHITDKYPNSLKFARENYLQFQETRST